MALSFSLVLVCYLMFTGEIFGCENEIWFQASDSIKVDHYATDLVSSVAECARKCYRAFPFCKSAIYEPLIFPTPKTKGYCKYTPWRLNCLPHVPLITNYQDGSKAILHCIHCLSPAPLINQYEESSPESVVTSSTASPSPTTTKIPTFVYTQNLAFAPETFFSPNIKYQNGRRVIILSVMSFNTWNSGNNVYDGLAKVARHINVFKPDVIGLQEMYDDKIDNLLILLQNQYNKCTFKNGSNYILTRWPIVEEYYPSTKLSNAGCKIELLSTPQVTVNVWNVHLHWSTYGPYAACVNDPHTVTTDILFNCEYKKYDPTTSRVHNMVDVLNHRPFNKNLLDSDKSPLILMGDFNSPSHLDWTDEYKRFHCDWSFVWPVSKLAENFGLKDSFREVHKNAAFVPGTTWSPVVKFSDNKTMEPQDRIDFIYYAGQYIRPFQSATYHGSSPSIIYYPYHYFNDWPSDHSAVITNFEIDIPSENK